MIFYSYLLSSRTAQPRSFSILLVKQAILTALIVLFLFMGTNLNASVDPNAYHWDGTAAVLRRPAFKASEPGTGILLFRFISYVVFMHVRFLTAAVL